MVDYMKAQEGMTKFQQLFTKRPPIRYEVIRELNSWRKILYWTKLIGQDHDKYEGAGYGNLSQRLEPYSFPRNKRRFVITGTQTGNLKDLTQEHYTIVLECYPEKNLVVVEGPIEASSESMTHGTIYYLDDSLRFVFHAHSPHIWSCSRILEIPTTRENVEYGTPEMAEEVRILFKNSDVKDKHIFSMGGHENGVITFGRTSEEAGLVMLKYLAKSLRLL